MLTRTELLLLKTYAEYITDTAKGQKALADVIRFDEEADLVNPGIRDVLRDIEALLEAGGKFWENRRHKE